MYTYLDREITVIRRIRIRVHLHRCPPCADGFHFESKLKDRVKSGCRDDPPAELYDRLRTFLQQHGATGESR
ncbi:MAG: zf-HC2 domain-containing protein [Acidimicrobiia bacterium]|nr:zf-HC2 domain-containing protein [Acidimicrobiia bacterium]